MNGHKTGPQEPPTCGLSVLCRQLPPFLGAPCSSPSCTSRKIPWELRKDLGVSYLRSQTGFLLCRRVTGVHQAPLETSAVLKSLSIQSIGFSFSPLCVSRYCFVFHLPKSRVVFSGFSVKYRKREINSSKKCVLAIEAPFGNFFSKGNSCSACSQQQSVPTKKLRTILKANKKELQNYCCCCSLLRKPNQKILPHFYSYIDTQIHRSCVGLLLLASAAGILTSVN